MTTAELTQLTLEALYLALWIGAPALGAALLIGLAVSVLSAATQVHEQALGYVPKLVGVALALAITGGWMASEVVRFTEELWRAIPTLVG